MNAIMGMTELVLEGGQISPEHRECLEIVGESAGSLLEVINDLLDLSKIEAGKFDLDPVDFELRTMLDDTVQSLALRAHKKGLEIGCDVARNVPEVLVGDPTRLRQVIVNLVGNAIKFTSAGEVFVRVRMDHLSSGQAQLHFSVVDTGIGVPSDKLQAIFEPFTQADGSTTRRFGGTGLGLTISSHLVRLMRGDIWAESELGRGSTFHFSVLLGVPSHSEASLTLPDVPFMHGLPVLVVEDNSTLRNILGDVLSEFGLHPSLADGPEAAYEILERAAAAGATFPLALVDTALADEDGFAFVETALERKLVGAAVAMLSSADATQDLERVRSCGALTHLRKPVKRADVIRVLRCLIESKSPATANRRAERRAVPISGPTGLHVLVVEDNPFNQKVSTMKLERWGHRVKVVSSGKEALAALAENAFDIMLADVQMPDMDGYELTAAVRNWESSTERRLPIVAMTAHAMKGIRERCLAAGMDDYVSKPIRDEELLAAIRRTVPARQEFLEDTSNLQKQDTGELMPPREAALDEAAILDRVGGNREVLQQLIGVFYQDCNNYMDQLKAAIKRGNAQEVRSLAHTIKGMVSFFGVKSATNAAVKVEQAGIREELSAANQLFGALARELSQFEACLSRYAPSPPDGWHLGLGARSEEDVFSEVGAEI
jgi:CheY-like chemotaxis protein/HPt (histidine-containing phosphotransfer) domain-containing protein